MHPDIDVELTALDPQTAVTLEWATEEKGIEKENQISIEYAVAEWYEAGLCDREVAGSTPARGCCVPTPTQRAIPPGSVNE